jgi:hypothetical protein
MQAARTLVSHDNQRILLIVALCIASSEMLLDAEPLPHLKCCQRRAAGEVRYEADRHDDTR